MITIGAGVFSVSHRASTGAGGRHKNGQGEQVNRVNNRIKGIFQIDYKDKDTHLSQALV